MAATRPCSLFPGTREIRENKGPNRRGLKIGKTEECEVSRRAKRERSWGPGRRRRVCCGRTVVTGGREGSEGGARKRVAGLTGESLPAPRWGVLTSPKDGGDCTWPTLLILVFLLAPGFSSPYTYHRS